MGFFEARSHLTYLGWMAGWLKSSKMVMFNGNIDNKPLDLGVPNLRQTKVYYYFCYVKTNKRYGCWCIWCFFNGLKWCQWIWYGLIWFKLVYNILWLYVQNVLMLMLMDLSWLIWLLCGRYGGRAEISFWNWSWIEVVGSRIQISLKKHCLNIFFEHIITVIETINFG